MPNVTIHPDCALVLKCLDMSPAQAARYTTKMLKRPHHPAVRVGMVRTLAQLDQYLAAVRDLTARPARRPRSP